LPSLVEYVQVSQDERRVEIHRRRGDIGWEKIEHAGDEDGRVEVSRSGRVNARDLRGGVASSLSLDGRGSR
jgi:hypothetical protein